METTTMLGMWGFSTVTLWSGRMTTSIDRDSMCATVRLESQE
jgi:hypothetical protein